MQHHEFINQFFLEGKPDLTTLTEEQVNIYYTRLTPVRTKVRSIGYLFFEGGSQYTYVKGEAKDEYNTLNERIRCFFTVREINEVSILSDISPILRESHIEQSIPLYTNLKGRGWLIQLLARQSIRVVSAKEVSDYALAFNDVCGILSMADSQNHKVFTSIKDELKWIDALSDDLKGKGNETKYGSLTKAILNLLTYLK